jgi:hypothetical protein
MFFRRKQKPGTPPPQSSTPAANPSAVPPVIPKPPVIGVPPKLPEVGRLYHHEFTHQFLPDAFTGQNRARFIGALASPQFEETMRGGWQAMARLHGAQSTPTADMHVSAFRHESCLCGFFVFPPALHPKEAIAGLVIAGPAESWPPLDFAKLPVRYFVLERTEGPLTFIKEHTARGFVKAGFGPGAGKDVRDFIELVFGIVFGRKGPTAKEVAGRLLVLRHLVVYAQAAPYGKTLHAHPDLSAEAKDDLHAIMGGMFSDTLRKEGLWDYVTAKEKVFFETRVQDLAQKDLFNAFWRKEAVHALMWSLNLKPTLGPCDVEASPNGALKTSTTQLLEEARLRDEREIEKAREVAELWHWRSRTRELHERNQPFQPNDALKKAGIHTYADVIRMTAGAAAKDGDIPAPINDDFPAFSKAYRDLNPEEWSRIRSVTSERHYTLNWVCGYALGNDWDRTPTHT